MAISTKFTFLMLGTTSGSSTTWEKLINIREVPDLEGSPSDIDVTTLSDYAEQSIPGLLTGSAYDFPANYSAADYSTIKGMEGTEVDLAVWIGGSKSGSVVTPTGSNGKFSFKGYVTAIKNGGGVNDAHGMTVHVNRTSDLDFDAS